MEIILASASPQRRKLLKQTGIKFKVIPSRSEEITKISKGYADLVMRNALLKAQSVARQRKAGIVIGADTDVFIKGQIIGKPKNFKDAKRILKLLTSSAHWVYTGVAIIDIGSGKTLVDYEKTKLFMNKLADREIDQYHAKTLPLDKAGGFDIEGRGGLFIRRIEGCYSNVIGLPLAKLRLMLKEFGVNLL